MGGGIQRNSCQTTLNQRSCISKKRLMVFCIISVSSFFLFLGLRNLHAVQFSCLSVLKQQFKAGLTSRPSLIHSWIGAQPLCRSCKPYQTEKPQIGGSVTVGKGAFRMCFVSECRGVCVRAYVCVCVCLHYVRIQRLLVLILLLVSLGGQYWFPLAIANQFLRCSIKK